MLKEKWVRIMAEHGCDGVWRRGGGAADIGDLPISAALQERLIAWNSEYGRLIDPAASQRMGYEAFDVAEFSAEGWVIAQAIKAEIPGWTVEYFDEQEGAWKVAEPALAVIQGLPPAPGVRWRILGKFPQNHSTDKELAAWEEAHGPLQLDPHPPKKSGTACHSAHTRSQPAELTLAPSAKTPSPSVGDQE